MLEYADLIGQPYDAVGGCWGLAATLLRRCGFDPPASQEEALVTEDLFALEMHRVVRKRTGDVLLIYARDRDQPHAAFCLDETRCIHVTRGTTVRTVRIDAVTSSGMKVRILRPRRKVLTP